MIISASRRTDIPAFFSEWFINRVREGFLCVRNPMNAHQVSRISLSPSVVDCIVFWTKNPAPMLGRLDDLADYQYYFQATLTGYGHDVEPGLPDKRGVLVQTLRRLAADIGPERVVWRYDPILFNEKYTPEYHLRAIRSLAEALEGSTEKCVISFVDVYGKNRRQIERLGVYELEEGDLRAFASQVAETARRNGMAVGTCAERIDLSECGIEHNCCIDKALIERLVGAPMDVKKDKGQRLECGCMASIDIGSYNTCPHNCAYCYANYSPDAVARAYAAYDPASPILCGTIGDDDKITERKMRPLAQFQLGFDAEGAWRGRP